MNKRCLLIDFDDTIVDFHDAEAYAFHQLTKKYNLETDQNDLNQFITVNQAHWEAFQQNQLTKTRLIIK